MNEDHPGNCRECGGGQPVTITGHCAACAAAACSIGNGCIVGLRPVDDFDVEVAVAAARRHLWTCRLLLASTPASCPVCAHLARRCPDCDLAPEQMDSELADAHTFTEGGTVLIGCEGYHTPLLRAAALHLYGATEGVS